jgi:hypothetical protein
MVKEHSLGLMEESMLENGRITKFMVKEHSLFLVETNMLVNSRMVFLTVKGHTLSLMVESLMGEYKNNRYWNGTGYNKNGGIDVRFVNVKMIEQ